jgi:uncharacterized membrane protein (UPF0127 family)
VSSSRNRTIVAVVALVGVAVLAGCTGPLGGEETPAPAEPTATPDPTATQSPTATPEAVHESYEQTTVTAVDGETGEELGRVEAAIADTPDLRYTGLSETDALPPDRGMLFVYDSEGSRTYVMRNMSFAIDIVYVGANGTVRRIHEAPKPGPDEDGEQQRYPGTGQYVLEVNRGWMAEHNVTAGDRLEFELPE